MSQGIEAPSSISILVVEDDAVIGMGLKRQLIKLGYHVADVVASGEEAISRAQDTSPDLVLMDIKLKGDMDGIEAAAEIRSRFRLPVIYLTAHEDDHLVARAKKTEPFGYLTKPYRERELDRTIEMALYKASTEKKLQESEARYRDMVELAPQFVYEVDAHGRFIFVNKLGLSLSGYSEEEFRNVPAWSFFSKESSERMTADMAKVFRGEKATGTEYRLVRKDGGEVPIQAYYCPIARDGKVVGIRGIAVDVSERKRMEQALRASEERFKTICDSLPDAVLVIREAIVVHANPSVKQVIGYEVEEILGKHFSVLFPPEDRLSRAEALETIRINGSVFEGAECLRADRSKMLVDMSVVTIPWNQDYALLVTLRDSTERIMAQKSLKLAKEEWERTFDAVPDLIAIIDTEHRMRRVNKAMADKLGMTPDEAVGARCCEAVHGTSTAPDSCPHTGLLGDGAEHSAEVFVDRLGGTFHVTVSPLCDSDGTLVGCVHVARDISDRKLAETKQNELMEELRRFTYFVSHDLAAPMINVKGFSRELESALEVVQEAAARGARELPAQQKAAVEIALGESIPEALRFIGASMSQMDHLIGAVMVLSRTERRALLFESLDMHALVEEVLNSSAYQINHSGVQVTVGALPEIVADRTSMEQIVANLVGNAIKYLDPTRPGQIQMEGHHLHEEVVFAVRDNGRGIEEADLSRIFHVFQRAGIKDVPGEGMGLAHVRALVRRHGGRIWCESEPGVGSVFTFTISRRISPGESLS